jgi:hypothetical protein
VGPTVIRSSVENIDICLQSLESNPDCGSSSPYRLPVFIGTVPRDNTL